MTNVAHCLLVVAAILLPSACVLIIAVVRGRRRERARLWEDHRVHVVVTRTHPPRQPQGNLAQFSPRAERNAHNG